MGQSTGLPFCAPFLYFGAYCGVEKYYHSEMCNESLLFFLRTAPFAFLVQHLCCPALLAVNFCTCSWRTSSEVNFIVFHNAGFSLALLSTLDALKPFCNCLISGMDPCRRYFMQMDLQIKMIDLLIQSTSINYKA